jgi:putative transposase
VTYDTHGKELKQSEDKNRILRKLLSNKEIELEVRPELLKKIWDIRSKKD